MNMKSVFIFALAVTLSACASTPPEPAPTPVVQEVIPAPQPVIQAPVEQVQREEIVEPEEPLGPEPGTLEDFIYTSGGDARIYFAYDQYDLSPYAREVLRQQADWLMRYPEVLAVMEGHADERGTREYNLALAARRADAAKTFVVSLGVAPNRLTTVSYGKERPIDARSTEEGWAKNRNALTNILSGINDVGE